MYSDKDSGLEGEEEMLSDVIILSMKVSSVKSCYHCFAD